MVNVHVCVFAKPPVPGRVKTRLGSVIGAELAAQLAHAMLCDVCYAVRAVGDVELVLAATEQDGFPEVLAGTRVWLQGEGDLGTRMERIFQRGLRDAAAVIAIGADSPQLSPEHIQQALRELEQYDAVIGPSLDGGYYLLGLKRCSDGLLEGLPWSVPETRMATEERLRANLFTIATLEPVPDVDIAEDLLNLISSLEQRRDGAPATRRWVARNRDELRRLLG
jgi:uncharacterized protein